SPSMARRDSLDPSSTPSVYPIVIGDDSDELASPQVKPPSVMNKDLSSAPIRRPSIGENVGAAADSYQAMASNDVL
ncbi:hypothetical protein NL351_27355, partial [Klebsiella pneumoniae]|nr:hypothetical protein [Klebsiella pneumoniae]